jgi:predicted nucleic acid-binding protein
MILADTSVWIDHLRKRDAALVHLLEHSEIIIHPFIVGELALGNLKHRHNVLETLNLLPSAVVTSHEETLEFIEKNQLQGFGIGYVDAHLLAATRLTPGATIWTRDRKLHSAAVRLALAAKTLS